MQLVRGLKLWFSKEGRNVAFHAGDSAQEEVEQNRREALESQGYSLGQLCFLNQVHGNEILRASRAGLLGEGDGILLDKKGLVGLIMVADCNPVVLCDRVKCVAVLLHAGRLGVERGIVFRAYEILQKQYQSNARDIFAYVGPSIRGCCYEVGREVMCEALRAGEIIKEGRIYLDLIAVLEVQFREIGICDSEISPLCTCCSGKYFSYRRDRKCGRFGMFVSLE